ncbi:unnamed protein product [Darwinula stevensoni]|uniref:Uncharacterized protein n=1 Tax=Darwinula stevensoni TaxID=69355 RepID=A0A7R8X8V7_9CRUS|nr:unnamed protein product [Darwinula stevensoni]CAG0888509.1 unnamed protein product [Darwinula stevensoni]
MAVKKNARKDIALGCWLINNSVGVSHLLLSKASIRRGSRKARPQGGASSWNGKDSHAARPRAFAPVFDFGPCTSMMSSSGPGIPSASVHGGLGDYVRQVFPAYTCGGREMAGVFWDRYSSCPGNPNGNQSSFSIDAILGKENSVSRRHDRNEFSPRSFPLPGQGRIYASNRKTKEDPPAEIQQKLQLKISCFCRWTSDKNSQQKHSRSTSGVYT